MLAAPPIAFDALGKDRELRARVLGLSLLDALDREKTAKS